MGMQSSRYRCGKLYLLPSTNNSPGKLFQIYGMEKGKMYRNLKDISLFSMYGPYLDPDSNKPLKKMMILIK